MERQREREKERWQQRICKDDIIDEYRYVSSEKYDRIKIIREEEKEIRMLREGGELQKAN